MSKKIAILVGLLVLTFASQAQVTVDTAIVPTHCQGVNGTNNNRVPCWFWVELSGLTPGATYRYYTTMDTLNASPTSNGAGVPMLINATSGTIRRTTNASLTNPANHDSLVADSSGQYKGWFGVDASGNARYTPGNTIYPKLIMNNGAGGTSVATRLLLSSYPVMVINFGTASSSLEGTALYDSLNSAPKNFNCLYDNTTAMGRPVTIAITENDGLDLYSLTSTALFYRDNVDTMSMRWGTIIPNTLANGIRAIEERAFTGGAVVDVVTDADGWWCSGVNTSMMTGGNTGTYLNSTFVLTASATIPDTVWVGLPANMSAMTNDTGATITWDFGDTATATGANVSHTYDSAGTVSVTVIISNGGCSDTIWHNVVVELGLYIPRQHKLAFDIHPNPSNGIFTIASPSAAEKEVEIYNVLGDVVYTTTYTGSSANLDLSTFDKGVYLIRMRETVTGGRSATKRIILQ